MENRGSLEDVNQLEEEVEVIDCQNRFTNTSTYLTEIIQGESQCVLTHLQTQCVTLHYAGEACKEQIL